MSGTVSGGRSQDRRCSSLVDVHPLVPHGLILAPSASTISAIPSAKRSRDFGKGLEVEVRKVLVGEPNERRKQICKLIARWVEARIGRMNLTGEKERALRDEIKAMSGKGTEALERLKDGGHGDRLAVIYKDGDFLPIVQWCHATRRELRLKKVAGIRYLIEKK
ncbi:MAG: hypothetical protein AB8D78_14340 [Akkermansiaceae bacterium]